MYVEFEGKNGIKIFGEIGGFDRRDFLKKKNPIVHHNELFTNLYTTIGNKTIEYKEGDPSKYEFTDEGIKSFINSIRG